MDFSCFEITTVATAFPIKLVTDLASLIKRSTPMSKASPSRGMTLIAAKVDAKTIKPLPVTPAAPLLVISKIPKMVNCCEIENSTSNTCAKNMMAILK